MVMGGLGCVFVLMIISWLWFVVVVIILMCNLVYKLFVIFMYYLFFNCVWLWVLVYLGVLMGFIYLIEIMLFMLMVIFIVCFGMVVLVGY